MTQTDSTVNADVDVSPVGATLGQRVRHVSAALRRLDGLEGRPGGPDASRPSHDDMREFALRALRAAGDRDTDILLRAVAGGTHDEMGLVERTGRPRLALWESVGDLLQVGLLARDPVTDRVHLTAAGAAMLALVDAIAAAAEEQP
jgi:hypothetical protein